MSDDISVLGIAVEQRGVKEGTAALDKLAESGKRAEKSTDGLTGASKKATFEISALAKSAAGAFAGFQIAGLASEFIKTADAMTLMNARLRLVTSSQAEFSAVQSGLIAMSKDNRAGLGEMAALYTKLAAPIKAVGGGMAETMQIVDSFSKSLKIGGASAQEAASATLQFAQAMASGKLSGDEFRSIAEASPRFMKAIADGIGIPVGALKELSTQGGLTADVVGNALMKMNAQLSSEFGSLPGTVGDAMQQVRNEFSLAVDEINTASGATSGLAGSISALAESIRPIGSIFAEASKGMKGTGDQADVMNAALAGVRVTLETLLVSGANVSYMFQAVGREIGGIAAQIAALSKGDLSGFSAIGDAMREDAEAARKAVDQYSKDILSAYEKSRRTPIAVPVPGQPATPTISNAASALKAPSSLQAYLADTSNAPRAAKVAAEVEKENAAFKNAITGLSETSQEYQNALKAHNERIAEITKEPKGTGGGSDGIANATLSFDLARIKRESDQLAAIYAGSERVIEAQHAAGLMSDREYYEAKGAFIRLNAEAQEQALQQEISRLASEQATGKYRIENLQKIADAQAQIEKIRLEAGFATQINETQAARAIKQVTDAYDSARRSAQAYLDTVKLQNQRELDGMGMGSAYRADQAGRNQIEDKFSARRNQLTDGLIRGEIKQEDYDKYLDLARNTYQEEIRLYTESREAIRGKQEDWAVGAAEAFANYAEEARNAAKQTEDLFTNAFSSAEDAFVEFAKTGKLSFSDLADSIIEDMARIAFKQASAPILSGISEFIAKSFSGFNSGGIDYSMLGTGYVSGARASGGPVSSGETYLVGERGPELLTMGGNGYITPNNALGGGMNVTINNSVADQAEVSVQPKMNNGQMELEVIVQRVLAKDMNRNGPITQGLAGTFGLARAI